MRPLKAFALILVVFVAGWLLFPGRTSTTAGQQALPREAVSNLTPFHEEWSITTDDDPLILGSPLVDAPPDPTSDIGWPSSVGYSGVADIQDAFNYARTTENFQLGISIPMLSMPSQAEWDAMSDGQKALWLINRERIDRGVQPLHGLETNVTSVAQTYAQWLINNNAWGHYNDVDGDGVVEGPWDRLHDDPAIAPPAISACHDFLGVAENLAVFMTSGSSIPLPIERSVYLWMYDDGSCCSWGHRYAILYYPYADNSGPADQEGFLGIGRANGPYEGWNYAEMIVMNVFDPCASWNYGVEPTVQPTLQPPPTPNPYLTEKAYLPCVLKNY